MTDEKTYTEKDLEKVSAALWRIENDEMYREQFIDNIMKNPAAIEMMTALQPVQYRNAGALADTLEVTASIAKCKDWGPNSAVQWKAGHFLAVELLRAYASGKEDLSEIILKWLEAAADGQDITPETRAERNGTMPGFKWSPTLDF